MKKSSKKVPPKFFCEKCLYASNRKSQWIRHLSTTKHKMDNLDNPVDNPQSSTPCYKCVCGKQYKYNSGLSKHKKKCLQAMENNKSYEHSPLPTTSSNSSHLTVEMFNKVVQQNNTLMEKLVEMSKDRQVINYQNCNNKKMTINVFLNEQCKNAMNLTDFVENVKVSLDDLQYTRVHGYVKGISNIFAKNLQDLDQRRDQFIVLIKNDYNFISKKKTSGKKI